MTCRRGGRRPCVSLSVNAATAALTVESTGPPPGLDVQAGEFESTFRVPTFALSTPSAENRSPVVCEAAGSIAI